MYTKSFIKPYPVSGSYFYRRLCGENQEKKEMNCLFDLLGEFECNSISEKQFNMINRGKNLHRYCGVGNKIINPLVYRNLGNEDVELELEFEIDDKMQIYVPSLQIVFKEFSFTHQFTIKEGEDLKLFIMPLQSSISLKVKETVVSNKQ